RSDADKAAKRDEPEGPTKAPEAEAGTEDPGGKGNVSSLFARIKEETEEPEPDDTETGEVEVEAEVFEATIVELDERRGEVTVAEVVTVELVEEVIVDEDDAVDAPGPEASTDPDQVLKAQRDAALDELARSLTRRVKRELSDEQNELLDTVRRQKGRPSA